MPQRGNQQGPALIFEISGKQLSFLKKVNDLVAEATIPV
jgi:hypothetical protein